MKFTPEQKQAMADYEAAKLAIKELEVKIEELKPIVLSAVPEETNVMGEKGYFYIQKKKDWKYSSEVEEEEKKFKKMKADEIAKGIATATESNILFYREGEPKVQE